jgi:hypothetical protein
MALAVSFGQQSSSDQSDRAELLQKLHSVKVDERVSAYEKLSADSSALRDPDVKAALIDLLDRENHVELNAEQEGYVEYVSNLIETVTNFVDWTDQHQVCVLVHSAFPPKDGLAEHPRIAMPCLLQKARSNEGLTRGRAVAILVQALGTNELDPATVETIRKIVLGALHDQTFDVRVQTVEALERFGREDMIPALQQVAETDPTPAAPNGYSIRKLAVNAIAAIQKRTGPN